MSGPPARAPNPNLPQRRRSRLRTYSDPSLLKLAAAEVQPELSINIVFVGGKAVGKSTLVRAYAEKRAPRYPTAGADVHIVPHGVLIGRQVYLRLIDISHMEVRGKESFLEMHLSSAAAVVVMFDVTDAGTLRSVDEWAKLIGKYTSIVDTPVLLLANKVDLLCQPASIALIIGPRYVRKTNGVLQVAVPFYDSRRCSIVIHHA